jgi:hypothetical protein
MVVPALGRDGALAGASLHLLPAQPNKAAPRNPGARAVDESSGLAHAPHRSSIFFAEVWIFLSAFSSTV